MADVATNEVSDYVAKQGIKISKIAQETHISDGILRRSLSTNKRDLRAAEFLKICRFLGKNPFDFWPTDKPE